nr:hypothetical protein [uncultured Blautia sp.]
MNRLIGWQSREFDEIELVYEKAEAKEQTGKLLGELEKQALSEAKMNCGLLTTDAGKHITSDQFDCLRDIDKETVIRVLSNMGLGTINQDIGSATLYFRLTSKIQKVLGCTIFNILNRLEKLDGVLNMLIPKWTLELQVPLGGKQGLFQWEMLIMQLYPWISIRETSTNETAEELVIETQQAKSEPEEEKKDVHQFLKEMHEKSAFVKAMEIAKGEIESIIRSGLYTRMTEKDFTIEQWKALSDIKKEEMVISMGLFSFYKQAVICVDFIKYMPYTPAIGLLLAAWNGTFKEQILDAGDGVDVSKFVEALTLLYDCCKDWECKIMSPVMVTITSPVVETEKNDNRTSNPPEKKSFWKRLFGK